MSPGLLPEAKVKRLDGLLCGLLRGEACPFVAAGAARVLRLLQVSLRLFEPIAGAICLSLGVSSCPPAV